jgi:hypothetical protein
MPGIRLFLSKLQVYLLIAYLFPLFLLVWLVASFSVNVPFWDQWELVELFDKVAAGSASLRDFFAQQNEHRLFFPRLIFVGFAFVSKWNIRLELCLSILLAIVTFLAIYKIATTQENKNGRIIHFFNILSCILIFSLVQHENWLWGFQVAWLFINACVTLSVFILTVPQKWLPVSRLTLSALCCFIASFSSAHGLLSWLAVAPALASVEGNIRQKKIRLLLWMLFFALSFAIYSMGYQKPISHPDTFFFLKKPLIALNYFLTILGYPIGKLVFTPFIGGLLISLTFLFFNIYSLKNYQSEFTHKATPWLSLGWFATLFALMTTVGRAGLGVEQATASRYTTVIILLVISCLQMWRLFICYKRQGVRKNQYHLAKCSLFACILIAILIATSTKAIAQGKQTWQQRTSGETCLEIIHFFEPAISESPDNCLQVLYPSTARLINLAASLERLGFRDFPRELAFTSEPLKHHGSIDNLPTTNQLLTIPRSGSFKVSGWAMLPERRVQPKVALLSYGSNQSFFATGVIKLKRPDVAKALNSSRYNEIGWEVDVSPKSIPLGETVIKAWLYDPSGKQFVKLSGELKLKVVE